ncbi:MAG: 2,3-epoxybenzoyl-CoA dihydrolase, partial [Geodermatophilaceae bacterium]
MTSAGVPVTETDAEPVPVVSDVPTVSFRTRPEDYKHWKLSVDGEVATLTLDVDEQGGIVPGYELKLNSYDLGVDIELYDATNRLRFEHPEVKAVVVTSGKEKSFCAGANIRMLAQSNHPWKVNFCKFTNETRNGMEDATENSGQTYLAAVTGAAAGGGYELALACDQILLIDDNSSAVSLPELPLLGVLPGTGGLTRVVDKRGVRKDLADVFATKSEGIRGKTAVAWRLVDAVAPKKDWAEAITAAAGKAAKDSQRLGGGAPVALTPLEPTITDTQIAYRHIRADLDRDSKVATITVFGPPGAVPENLDRIYELGADFWPLAMSRELDDLILHLRTNELELGTWVLKTKGDPSGVLAFERVIAEHSGSDWFVNEIRHLYKRVLKRLDVTSRSLIAVIEPGSCFAGPLLELVLAADRQYMLEGLMEDGNLSEEGEPAQIVLTDSNFGAFPMSNGLSRLESRFYGDPDQIDRLRKEIGARLVAEQADELGLLTFSLDDIDWDEEIRIATEERSSFSPDALTGMEAN